MKKSNIDFTQNIAPTSKRFESNVLRILPISTIAVWINHVGMERAGGAGSYKYVLGITIDGCRMDLKVHSNSSPNWDHYKSIEYGSRENHNWNKATALMILEDQKDYIQELLSEEL